MCCCCSFSSSAKLNSSTLCFTVSVSGHIELSWRQGSFKWRSSSKQQGSEELTAWEGKIGSEGYIIWSNEFRESLNSSELIPKPSLRSPYDGMEPTKRRLFSFWSKSSGTYPAFLGGSKASTYSGCCFRRCLLAVEEYLNCMLHPCTGQLKISLYSSGACVFKWVLRLEALLNYF